MTTGVGATGQTFLCKFLCGDATAAEIDDHIDAWHSSGSELPLHAYLGMTAEQYAAWVIDASSLKPGGPLLLSSLEKRGLASLIGDVIELLRAEFDGVVGNGSRCRICEAYGFGTPESHTPGCRGVAMLRDLREVKARLGGEAEGDL